jgi:hypothetical protein
LDVLREWISDNVDVEWIVDFGANGHVQMNYLTENISMIVGRAAGFEISPE